MVLRNNGTLLPDYTVSYPTKTGAFTVIVPSLQKCRLTLEWEGVNWIHLAQERDK
jgi:hypothetical protein